MYTQWCFVLKVPITIGDECASPGPISFVPMGTCRYMVTDLGQDVLSKQLQTDIILN